MVKKSDFVLYIMASKVNTITGGPRIYLINCQIVQGTVYKWHQQPQKIFTYANWFSEANSIQSF